MIRFDFKRQNKIIEKLSYQFIKFVIFYFQFLQFVRNLSTNGLNNPNAVKTLENNLADLVANHKNNITELDETNADSDLANEWVKEFEANHNTNNNQTNTATSLEHNSNGNNFWEDLQDEWNTAAT